MGDGINEVAHDAVEAQLINDVGPREVIDPAQSQ